MDHHDQRVGQLLVEASPATPTDPHRLVAAGITRGRALRRRQRAGTAAAALAVLGVIGVGAAVVPSFGDGSRADSTPVVSEPTPSQTTSPSPSVPPSTPPSVPLQSGDVRIAVTAAQVPATVADLLGRDGAGPLRTDGPYSSASPPDDLVAHFSWQGTLTSVMIEADTGNAVHECESGGPGTTCSTTPAGDPQLLWGPSTGDGVTAQGATVWQQGFRVSVVSYNAPDGKGVAPTMAAPPLTLDDLARVAGSVVWFE